MVDAAWRVKIVWEMLHGGGEDGAWMGRGWGMERSGCGADADADADAERKLHR